MDPLRIRLDLHVDRSKTHCARTLRAIGQGGQGVRLRIRHLRTVGDIKKIEMVRCVNRFRATDYCPISVELRKAYASAPGSRRRANRR